MSIECGYRKLEQIIKLCKEKEIRLVLITTPCWHSYYDNLSDNQLNKMYSIIHELQQKYDLPYFNYLKDKRFTEEDFFNGSHLSDVGEKKFTIILNKDIVSLEKGYGGLDERIGDAEHEECDKISYCPTVTKGI